MKRLLLLIPFFVLAACELVVDIDVPDGGPQMAVNALTPGDSSWRIDVSKAWGILDDTWNVDSVTNAIITVTDETAGTSVVLARQYYGRYRSDEKPIASHRYSLKVEAEGYPDVTASTIAPGEIQILEAEFDTVNIVRFKNENYDQVRLTFIDPPGVNNTYEIITYTWDSVYMNFQENPRWQVYRSAMPYTYINDPALVEKDDFFNFDAYAHRFTDESFEGQQKTITILVPGRWRYSGAFSILVTLFNQGYEYAKFVDDRNLQYDVQGFPFAQPVPVYSNLSNRNGIFAVKTPTLIEFKVK